jgi:eukaryotic-like serine/threonine-protein kinase
MPPMNVSVTDPLVGRTLDGRYVVRALIAKGGMAVVYRALDQRLDREVAVKVMNAELVDDEEFVARFSREARAAARLNHPGIVQVFDQGRQDGVVFLTMEHVPGGTLRDLMRERGAMPARRALDTVESVLEALAVAHRAGVVHRDIKPENVLIRDDGRIKVADFGLARLIDTSSNHSQTGVLFGTVAYLAPEQVERGTADVRSDVYATGVMLFEMLTGTKPFSGDSPVQVALQHVSSRVPAPSSRVVGLATDLDRLLALATARDPEQRPADAHELLIALRETRRGLSAADLDASPVLDPSGPVPPDAETGTRALDQPTLTGSSYGLVDQPSIWGRISGQAPIAGLKPERRMQRWRRPSRGGAAALAILLSALVLGIAGWLLGAGPGHQVTVPYVVGLRLEEAQGLLEDRGLRPTVTRAFDGRAPAETVIATRPGAGASRDRNAAIELVVSRGPQVSVMPAVVGQTEQTARDLLTQRQLGVDTVDRRYDGSVAKGVVISASVESGLRVPPGTNVSLIVSRGPQPVQVTSWVGRPADQAARALSDDGLNARTTRQYSDSVEKGLVISQDPDSGTAAEGGPVTLVVSAGPKPGPTKPPGPKFTKVPAVIGQQASAARRTLRDQGFEVQERQVGNPATKRVIAQFPRAGARVKTGSTVTLVVQ